MATSKKPTKMATGGETRAKLNEEDGTNKVLSHTYTRLICMKNIISRIKQRIVEEV